MKANISEYLKKAGDNAWLMNDSYFMIWDRQKQVWVVSDNASDKSLKHTVIYEGKSLSDALKRMSGRIL